MANVDDVPVFGMQFDNGFSLDGMISDQFFGIGHDVYEDTVALRLGYALEEPVLEKATVGIEFHYTRQEAKGDDIFNEITGHAIDAKISTEFELGPGTLEMSISHDRFMGGAFHFLGQKGKMEAADHSAAKLGWRVDFYQIGNKKAPQLWALSI